MEEEGADEWLALTLADTAVVADMLMRIRFPQLEPPRVSQAAEAAAALPGKWGVVKKRPRTTAKLAGWCDWDVEKHQETALPVQQEVEVKGKAGSPMTPLAWSGLVGSGGSGGDGSDSSSDRQVKAERTVPVAAVGGGGVRLKAAAREANASRLPTKRPAKKKTISVLREEESQLVTERANLEKEMKRLMEIYMVVEEQNKRLKRLHERLQTMPSLEPVMVATGNQTTHFQISVAAEEPKPVPLQPCGIDKHVPAAETSTSSSSPDRACEEAFVLPDLNLPLEDGFEGVTWK